MKFTENRLSQSDRASLYDTADDTTDGIAFSFCLVNIVSHLLGKFLIRTAYRIVFNGTQIVCGIVFIQLEFSYLRSEGRDANAKLPQCQFGKGAGYDTGDGFTG